MRKKMQGQGAVLLFVLFIYLTCQAGCGRKEAVIYEAGTGERQTDRSDADRRDADESETETKTVITAEEGQAEKAQKSETQTSEVQTGEAQSEGYVYVCGAVQCPGVYPIRGDMRVFEAVELAGGFLEEADKTWLNLAGHLQDGQQLYIYTSDETAQMEQEGIQPGAKAEWKAEGPGGAAAENKVNLNTADLETLMTLPGIGRVKAEEIIRYREEHGSFSSTEEIQNIPGIKQAVFSKIEDRITV